MRNILFIALSLFILTSCGSEYKDATLEKLNHDKDSLLKVNKTIGEKLTEIENFINERDTSFEKSLPLVTVIDAEEQKFSHYFNIHGLVESDKMALILPEAGGLIKSLKVKEGDKIRAGQVMARLDASVASSRMVEMETSYGLAKTIFEKQERLWNKKIGSEIEYLQAKNQKESLESAMNTLRSQMGMSVVKAPYAGVVDEVFLNVGEMASPMRPLFRIVNNGKVHISSEVSESHIRDVAIGAPVQVIFASLGDTILAQIDEVGGYINPENRSFKVKVNLDQSNVKYLPNLLATMKILDYVNEEVIVIKSGQIQQTSKGEDFVYILKQEGEKYFCEKRLIQVGKEYNGMTEVLGGIQPAERIIGEGARSVRQGQRVRI